MKSQYTRKQFRELIATGKEEKVMQELLRIRPIQSKAHQDIIILISGKREKLKNELMSGQISYENAGVETTKLNHHLLEIIELVRLDKSVTETPDTAPKEETKSKFFRYLLPIILIISLITVFVLRDTFFVKAYSFDTWEGEWTQQVQAHSSVLGGSLTFKKEKDKITGTAVNHYESSSITTSELFNITLSENSQVMYGSYETDIGAKGTFELGLTGPDSFKGYYTDTEHRDQKFYWNGEKVKN